MAFRLFIDDIREPSDSGWIIARSSEEAIHVIEAYGCPGLISFDHDLGGEDTSMRIVKWLVDRDLDAAGNFIPRDFRFIVHSANPIGSENIVGLLQSYLGHRRGGAE